MSTKLDIWTKDSLLAFEERIRQRFLAGEIRAPVHFSGGNEDQLIEIFKDVRREDWVVSTYRNHYHALLKGMPAEELERRILEGQSMFVCAKEHRFLSSALVAGMCPIAVGIAMGIKRRGGGERVWNFVGDMAAETGLFHESLKYATRHDLPVTFVVEDNGLSTETPTQKVWGEDGFAWRLYPGQPAARWDIMYRPIHIPDKGEGNCRLVRYQYERAVPHVGAGQWVVFR